MRINDSQETMDIEPRDINYFLGAYVHQFHFMMKNKEPKKIVFPMFQSIPHPFKPDVFIPIQWVKFDSNLAKDIVEDGKDIPEVTPEEEAKLDAKEDAIKEAKDMVQEMQKDAVEQQEQATSTSEVTSKAQEAMQKLVKPSGGDNTAAVQSAVDSLPEVRKPKQPPGGDIGSGHADNIGNRDGGFDRKIANYVRPDKPVDESEEIETNIEKQQ